MGSAGSRNRTFYEADILVCRMFSPLGTFMAVSAFWPVVQSTLLAGILLSFGLILALAAIVWLGAIGNFCVDEPSLFGDGVKLAVSGAVISAILLVLFI